jgi:hypothetical protein
MLTRELLEKKRDRAYKTLEVPHPDPAEAGKGETVTIRLRAMFSGEWLDLIRSLTGPDGKTNEWRNKHYTQLVLAFCLVDADGKRLLTDDDLNTAWWKTQSRGFITQAIDAALDFSGLTTSVAVETERKNSPVTATSDSSIELPQDSAIEPPTILSTTLD